MLVLQSPETDNRASLDSTLEAVLKTNPRVSDARATISSRMHNKVVMLDNPTATLTTKATRRKHHKRHSSQLASRKVRPAFGDNHQ